MAALTFNSDRSFSLQNWGIIDEFAEVIYYIKA